MKIVITTFSLSALIMMNTVAADTYVNGYTRENGTRVEGHYRSEQNDTAKDNWSYSGNVNPYTGKVGTSEHLQYDEPSNDYDAKKPSK